jgi:peptide-methionine (S)-S-oxide reductase
MHTVCELPPLIRARGEFPEPPKDLLPGDEPQAVVLAGGCFWCVEAVFRQVDGVREAVSGYAGGDPSRADYRSVCAGDTGHAEVVRVSFDPHRISFGQILKLFFSVAHDPTQRNRQGNDVGTQYRSAVFVADAAQREVVQAYIDAIDAAGVFAAPVATRLEPLGEFFRAEDYHQDYAARNPAQPYIAAVAAPKLAKLRKLHPDRLKTGEDGA